ncbi:hypothetical protein [Halioxenophilus sp. WMMB6]|uniref:hypothetical protein n=1 Tax=Halioxenophilus sp. WMMB6 TaxID=3073815 RepID=UPI00295F31B9|nr:hypothetical protein [Halioxenophilus sp. WMMB6]
MNRTNPAALTALQPGCSLAERGLLPGTLGALVKDLSSDRIGLLSNWHILVNGDSHGGEIVNHTRAIAGLDIGQPVADLGRYFLDRDGDAAVAWLRPGIPWSTKLRGTDKQLSGQRSPQVGDVLAKVGGRTGYTRARVTALRTLKVRFQHGPVEIDSLYLEPIDDSKEHSLICANGDSGSIWFDEQTMQAVALHYAGESHPLRGPLHSKACAIERVLERLEVSLL